MYILGEPPSRLRGNQISGMQLNEQSWSLIVTLVSGVDAYKMPSTGYRALNTEYRVRSAEHRVQGTRVQSPDRIESTENRVQSSEYQSSTEYKVQSNYRIQSTDDPGLGPQTIDL